MLPELSETTLIEWHMHVVESPTMNYDMIIGQDMLEEFGIIINFKTKQLTWDEVSIPMRSLNTIQLDGYFINESKTVAEATARTTRILDAHYEAADIDQIISSCHNLDNKQKQQLKNLLEEFIDLFDGTLGSGRINKSTLN